MGLRFQYLAPLWRQLPVDDVGLRCFWLGFSCGGPGGGGSKSRIVACHSSILSGLKKHRSNPSWIRSHLNDPYVREAQLRGFRSRAAFKLTEIDDRDRLFAPGQVVVDLGAAPGSWSQIIAQRVGSSGCVLAIDLLPLEPMSGVSVIQGDFREPEVLQRLTTALHDRPVDVVVSDMAPNISGIAASDQARHVHLCELALEFALDHLRPEGAFLVKAFQGAGFQAFHANLKKAFVQVSSRKPLASRERSSEMYLLARGLRRA